MATVIRSIGITGITGYPIAVQVKVLAGLSIMNIVGLGDQAVKEAKDRIESAFDQLGLEFPKKKIIVNLSPSDTKKSGTYFDLPMLIGLLIETEQLKPAGILLDEIVFIGEVGLSGELNHFKGVLPMVIEAKKNGYSSVILPGGSLPEASRVKGIKLLGFEKLIDVIKWIEKRMQYIPRQIDACALVLPSQPDFIDVYGHDHIMKFITAAAAGNHNLLMIGPPGCGKSMIAKRIPSILPELSEEEALEVMTIQSVAGTIGDYKGSLIRPFRSPHYNTSPNAIIGGGANAMPGEISLAHNGVLFLDELPEFSRQTIDSLRQPLEDRVVTVARVKQTNTFPSNFMLVAAMNPCKCGHFGTGTCTCSPGDVLKYRQRVSGPVYDRLDIQKYLGIVNLFEKQSFSDKFSSKNIRQRVISARQLQTKRFKNINNIRTNSQMETKHISEFCVLNSECRDIIEKSYEKQAFSVRSYNKILGLARTFADLDDSTEIRQADIVAALHGRDLEKEISIKF